MWTVIYIASSEEIAETMKSRLSSEGFLVKIRQTRVSKQFEILVPKGEVREVKDVLVSILP